MSREIKLTEGEIEQLGLNKQNASLTEEELNANNIWRWAFSYNELEERLGGLQKIVTSKDPIVDKAKSNLNIPVRFENINRFQLPIGIKREKITGLSFHMVNIDANTSIPSHSHNHGYGIFRVILKGNLTFNNIKLESGDWCWLPKNENESISTDHEGASVLLLYVWNQWDSDRGIVDGRFEKI